jgi:hypothetical protein
MNSASTLAAGSRPKSSSVDVVGDRVPMAQRSPAAGLFLLRTELVSVISGLASAAGYGRAGGRSQLVYRFGRAGRGPMRLAP